MRISLRIVLFILYNIIPIISLLPNSIAQKPEYNIWTINEGEDVTWDTPQVPGPNDVIVKEGATLTIKSTVYFNSDAKLIVERGGKLIVDENGKLTSNCADDLWIGVELWGNYNQHQSYTHQGAVEMINDGTIENAVCGINTIKFGVAGEGEETPEYTYTGGLVLVDGGIFKNNRVAVKFWPYDFTSSQSFFRDCQFISNNNMLEGTDPDKFIEMSDISGVKVVGSSFTDTRTVAGPDELTTGIEACDARFYVWSYGVQPSLFTGLYYGIRSYNATPNPVIEVNNAIFANNIQGMYLGGTNNASVTNCEFQTNSYYSGGYGLYLDQSDGYTIEENVFTGTGNYGCVGLIINHRGPLGDNVIYRNQFYHLRYAALAQNENRTGDEAGLQFRCNEFDPSCINNIMVTWPGQKLTKTAGIAASQGANLAQPDAPAGNRFSNTGPDPTDIYNEANHITYWYSPYTIVPKVRPIYVTESTVTVMENAYEDWTIEEGCPPSDQGGGGGSGGIEEIKGQMATSGYKADSVQSIINILKDGGSTEDLKWEVDLSTPPETYEVYNELMNNSPYISDTVMEAAIEKEEVLPNVMIRDVMVANPHNAKNELLMEKIEERSDPMPAYMKAQILQGRSLVSLFEELQSNLAFYRQQRTQAFTTLVKHYLTDTINPTSSTDSLMVLLENANSPGAKYGLAFLRMEQGDWSMGQSVLNNMPQQFNLSEEEFATHQQMTGYYNLVADLAQEGKTFAEADSVQVETLFEIEALQSGLPSVYARNVLLALGEITYEEPILLPDFTKSSAIHQEYIELMKTLDEHYYLKVYPNPAGDYLIIEHDLETGPDNAYVEIRNTKGEIVKHLKVTGKQNQQTVDTKKLKPGIYIATIYVDSKEMESVKFTKTN